MRVAEAVGETLAQLGVRQVSGLIGSGNFAATNALVAAGASFVAARHEGAAITIADAYARVSGEVGVCSVHQGPGLTNAVTGLTEAAKSRTPLLLLAADTAPGRPNLRDHRPRRLGRPGGPLPAGREQIQAARLVAREEQGRAHPG